MAFDGTEGGEITLQTAVDMCAEYRRLNSGATKAHFFGKDILNDILDQEGCVGIRMYYGIDSDDQKQLVLVGVDSDEKDMTALVADLSKLCPTYCDTSSPLNK